MLAVVDYGVGNLFSLQCSLKKIGAEAVVTDDVNIIKSADRIILPGVGAFGDAVKKLRKSGLFEVVIEEAQKGKPLMGICLGMQMLFEKSYEYGEYEGLGLIEGEIIPLKGEIPQELDIPHMGWNALKFNNGKSEIFKYINEGDCVYFVHSFFGVGCENSLIATAEYGIPVTAAVGKGNIYGCQFHPEKSGETGLKILKAFCEIGD
jgi:glutamine amidotransferase